MRDTLDPRLAPKALYKGLRNDKNHTPWTKPQESVFDNRVACLRSDTQQKNVRLPVRKLACFYCQRNLCGSTNDSLQDGEAPRGQASHNTFTDENLPLEKQHSQTRENTGTLMANSTQGYNYKIVATIQRWKERPHVAQQARRCSTFRKQSHAHHQPAIGISLGYSTRTITFQVLPRITPLMCQHAKT